MTPIKTLLKPHEKYSYLFEPIQAGNFKLDIQEHWQSKFHQVGLYELATYGKENKIPPTILHDAKIETLCMEEDETTQIIAPLTIDQLQILYDGCIAYSNTIFPNLNTTTWIQNKLEETLIEKAYDSHEIKNKVIGNSTLAQALRKANVIIHLVILHIEICGLKKEGI